MPSIGHMFYTFCNVSRIKSSHIFPPNAKISNRMRQGRYVPQARPNGMVLPNRNIMPTVTAEQHFRRQSFSGSCKHFQSLYECSEHDTASFRRARLCDTCDISDKNIAHYAGPSTDYYGSRTTATQSVSLITCNTSSSSQ